MNKLWVIKEERKDLRDAIVRDLKVSPVLAQLLVNRDLLDPSTVHQFLYGTKSSLHDPFLLKNMQKAVDRIRGAITRGEKILVYGDYDADGVSSVALLLTYLRRESAQVDWYLPHRVNEGYGLNSEAVEEIRARGVTLVITVDCGVTDAVEVALLNSHHIDTIVVDHHEIQKDSLPAAYAIVNPLQEGCTYPFKELAGVGLAYKLACALAGDRAHDNEEFLDLVAVGTVADVVSQTGENRILTRLGLQRLSKAPRVGLQALMEVAGLGEREVLAEHIGFVIGPRINVAGRIGSPELALRLLLSEKKEEALEIAAKLHSENGLRQKMQEKIFKEAVAKIDGQMNFKDTSVIVVWDEGWHPGVIGIVASKLVGRYYRPAIVFSLQEGRAKGSGRSIDNFNLLEAVSSCKDLFENFGGHEAACGITIDKSRLDEFRARVNAVAGTMLTPADLIPKIAVDAELPLSSMNTAFIDELKLLEPFGEGNPSPLFLSTNLRMRDRPKQFGRSGMRMWVTDKRVTCEAVCFNAADLMARCQDLPPIDLVYSPRIREIAGIQTLKLDIEDIKTS